MTLYSFGLPAISFQGERNVPSEEIISKLRERFRRIVLLYDNDHTGIECSTILSDIYDLENIIIPEDYGKDISEVTENKGSEFGQNLIDSLV